MPIKRTAELWKEISLNLSPDCSTEHIYFLLRVSALFIRTASCKRNDFPGEKPSLPVVCKLVCFPFAACLPWCASVMESIVKQLELHLGPFWSCCKLQAPVRAEVGGCRWGTGWATKQQVLSHPMGSCGGRQGSHPSLQLLHMGVVLGACSACLGHFLLWGNCECWAERTLWWNLRLL